MQSRIDRMYWQKENIVCKNSEKKERKFERDEKTLAVIKKTKIGIKY